MNKILSIALLAGAMATAAFAVDTLKAGDALPALSLTDQQDKPAVIATHVTRVIFAADNTGASMVTALLDSHAPTWLTDTNSVYLADIHKMPSLIAKMFALPQLREKPYTIVLGREEADLAMFPRQKGCVSLLPMADGKVKEVVFLCNEDELKARLVP